jgi:hypothetical protein
MRRNVRIETKRPGVLRGLRSAISAAPEPLSLVPISSTEHCQLGLRIVDIQIRCVEWWKGGNSSFVVGKFKI